MEGTLISRLREMVDLGGGARPRSRAARQAAAELSDPPGSGKEVARRRHAECPSTRSGVAPRKDHPVRLRSIVDVLRGTSGLWRPQGSSISVVRGRLRGSGSSGTWRGGCNGKGGNGRGDATRLLSRKTSKGSYTRPGRSGGHRSRAGAADAEKDVNPTTGCRVQQTCERRHGENRRGGEKPRGRNMPARVVPTGRSLALARWEWTWLWEDGGGAARDEPHERRRAPSRQRACGSQKASRSARPVSASDLFGGSGSAATSGHAPRGAPATAKPVGAAGQTCDLHLLARSCPSALRGDAHLRVRLQFSTATHCTAGSDSLVFGERHV